MHRHLNVHEDEITKNCLSSVGNRLDGGNIRACSLPDKYVEVLVVCSLAKNK